MVLFLLIAIVIVVVVAVAVVSQSGSWSKLKVKFPPGTRAWEAELTMGPLLMAIEQRIKQRDATVAPVHRDRLDRQIKFLSAQVDELQKIIDDRDTSPGKGFIGFQPPPEE